MAQDKDGIANRLDVTTLGRIDEFEVPTYDEEPQTKCVMRQEIARYGRRNFKVDGEYRKNQLVKFQDIHYHYIPIPEPEPTDHYQLVDIFAQPVGTNIMIAKPANSTASFIFGGKLKNTLDNTETNIDAGRLYIESYVFATNQNNRFSGQLGDYNIGGEEMYNNKLTFKSSYNNSSGDMAFGLCFIKLSYEAVPGQFVLGEYPMYVTQDGNVVYYHIDKAIMKYTRNFDMILADGSNRAVFTSTVSKYNSSDQLIGTTTIDMVPYFRTPTANHYKMYCDYPTMSVKGENLGTTVYNYVMGTYDVYVYSPFPDTYLKEDTYGGYAFKNQSYYVQQEANYLANHKRIETITVQQYSYQAVIDYQDRGLDTMISGYNYGQEGGTQYTRVNSDGACWYMVADLTVYTWHGYTSGAETDSTGRTSYGGKLVDKYKYENFEDVYFITGTPPGTGIYRRGTWIVPSNPIYDETKIEQINNAHQDVCNASAWLTFGINYSITSNTAYNFYATCGGDTYGSSYTAKKYAACTLEQWRNPVSSYSGRVEHYSVYTSSNQVNDQHSLTIPFDKYGTDMSPFVAIMAKFQKGMKQWKNGADHSTNWWDDDGTSATTRWDVQPGSSSYALANAGGNSWLKFKPFPYNDPSGSITGVANTYAIQYVENLYASNAYWWGVKLFPVDKNLTEQDKVITIDITYSPEQPKNGSIAPITILSAITITHECQGAVQPTLSVGTNAIRRNNSIVYSSAVSVTSNVNYWQVSSSTSTWLHANKSDGAVSWSVDAYTDPYPRTPRTGTITVYAIPSDASLTPVSQDITVYQPPPYLFVLTGESRTHATDNNYTAATLSIGSAVTNIYVSINSRRVALNYGTNEYRVEALDLNEPNINGLGGGMNIAVSSITREYIDTANTNTNYSLLFTCDPNSSTSSTRTQTIYIYQPAQEVGRSNCIQVTVEQEKHAPPAQTAADFLDIQWVSSNSKFYVGLRNTHTSRPIKVSTLWYYQIPSNPNDSISYINFVDQYGVTTIQPSTTYQSSLEINTSNPWQWVVKSSDIPSGAPSYVTAASVSWAD